MSTFTGFELFDLRDVSNGQIQSSAINLGRTGSWMIPAEVITAANNSGELLSGHIMYARANNGRLPTLNMSDESINFSQAYTTGHTNILFPITRVLNPNSVKVTVRCAGSNDGYWGGALEIGKVVNGEFIKYDTSAYTNRPSYNTDVDLLLDNLSSFEYIDYIVISCSNSSWAFKNIEIDGTVILPITSNGGGATHIAKVTGQLKDLSSNLSDILMVSGGGGGGYLVGENAYAGADAGGISGSGSNSGNQSTGYAFGQGESGTNKSGGGSGLYGGYKGTSSKSGGAGSGYIGNSLLSNKKMVGYNVPTSSAESTKTESVNEASESPVSGKPKIGNGFARIKFLREADISNMTEWIPDADFGWSVTFDNNTSENHITGRGNEYWEYYECPVSVKKNTNYVLSCQYKGSGMYYSTSNKDYLRIFNRFVAESEIRANNGLYGISGLTIIAESTDYFDSDSTYRDISVSFNSGNLTEIWICIGFGYGDYDANLFDVYFKNIALTEVT